MLWYRASALFLVYISCILQLSRAQVGPVNTIFTREAQYCSDRQAIAIDRFAFTYFDANKSVGFDINTRALASPPGETTFNINLVAYGMNPVNYSINICNEIGVLAEIICPLPLVDVSASGNVKLPDSFNFDIPEIGWYVPDLEAYAQITITDETGQEVACIRTQLSNGLTTDLPGVTWAVVGIVLFAFVVMIIHSLLPATKRDGPEWRFSTIFSYCQHVAFMGMLSLNHPLAYQAFTRNFAWTTGLIYMQPINNAINHMRNNTGGQTDILSSTYYGDYSAQNLARQLTSTDNNNNAAELTKRAFSNIANSFESVSQILQGIDIYHLQIGDLFGSSNNQSEIVPTVQGPPNAATVLGIATFSEALGIPYESTFFTAFIVFLLLICVLLAVLLLGTVLAAIFSLYKKDSNEKFLSRLRRNVGYFVSTNSLRILMCTYAALLTFSFYQFTIGMTSGWVAILFAVVSLIFCLVSIFWLSWHVTRKAKIHNPDSLYLNEKSRNQIPAFYSQYKPERWWFFMPSMVFTIVKAAFIGFTQGHPWVQLIPLVIIEVIYGLLMIIFRPFRTRSSLFISILIVILNLACYGLLFTAIPSVQIERIPATVCGFVVLAIQSIVMIILFFITLFNFGYGIIYRRNKQSSSNSKYHRGVSKSSSDTASSQNV